LYPHSKKKKKIKKKKKKKKNKVLRSNHGTAKKNLVISGYTMEEWFGLNCVLSEALMSSVIVLKTGPLKR
jgi:hypothetical protein